MVNLDKTDEKRPLPPTRKAKRNSISKTYARQKGGHNVSFPVTKKGEEKTPEVRVEEAKAEDTVLAAENNSSKPESSASDNNLLTVERAAEQAESSEDAATAEDTKNGRGKEAERASSAMSDISLVGFPSESEHRTLLRTVKLEMTEQQEKASERRASFLERSCTAQARAQVVTAKKISRKEKRRRRSRTRADSSS